MRAIGASNFTAERLEASLRTARRARRRRATQALQPHYNLVDRAALRGRAAGGRRAGGPQPVPVLRASPSGFLTGKYRDPQKLAGSPRAARRGAVPERVAGCASSRCSTPSRPRTATSVAAVALAWLAAQPTVTAPIASARTVDQVAPLLESTTVVLTPEQIDALDAASQRLSTA